MSMCLDKGNLVKICIFWYKAKRRLLVQFNYLNKTPMHCIEYLVKVKQVEESKKCQNFLMLISKAFTTIRLRKRKWSLE